MTQARGFEERLHALNPKIQQLMSIAGTAGLSLGVYRKDERPYYANFGFRDVTHQLSPTEQTIYPICSQTKMFTAIAMALLVDDPELDITWDTPVKDLLPELSIRDVELRECMTVTDILAHRTGMSIPHARLGSENNMLIAHESSMKFINDQVLVFPFRERWYYNNTGYEIAGLILDKFRGSWADVFREQFFGPLDMRQTFCKQPPKETENVSKAYNTLDDGTPCEIPTVKSGEGSFGGSSGGIFSCVEDLLKVYAEVMASITDQDEGKLEEDGLFPSKHINYLFSDKIAMRDPSGEKVSAFYTCGLARVTLPGAMGHVGNNPNLMRDGKMPIVGKGVTPTIVLWHQGALPGALSAIAMIPAIDTAIVILSNSLALNDCTDWVLQLIIEEILGCPEPNDYIAHATASASRSLDWYHETASALEHEKQKHTDPKPLPEYLGTYWNTQRYLRIDVTLNSHKLSWALQGLEAEEYELEHYEGDTFIWLRERNYLTARGRWVDQPPIYWKITFRSDTEGQVQSLNWVHEPNVPDGESFYKD